MKKLLILASFIYLFVAPFTHHPDNKLVLYWAGLDHGKVWNIWEYGQEHFPTQSQFNYPPFHFYLDKVQFAVASVIGGPNYYHWLATPNSSDPFEPQLARYALATKFVLILFGLLVGLMLYKLALQHGATESQSRLVAGLWLFNPIVIYSIPIMGQNDVMAIAFFLLGWLLLRKNQLGAVVAFGLAASIKMYPLVWLPFILLSTTNLSIKDKLKVFIGSILVYLLTLTPFISNEVFREAVLNSDINKRFFIGQIDLGFSDALIVVPLLLALAVFAATKLGFSNKPKNELATLTNQSFAVMSSNLVLLGFSHFHPQWFTWIIPFWAVWLVFQKKQTFWLSAVVSLLTFGAWLIIVLLFQDTYLSLGLLVPLNQTLANLPTIRDLLTLRGIDTLQLNNFAHTWLAAIGALTLLHLFREQSTDLEKRSPLNLDFRWQMPSWLTALIICGISIIGICAISILTYFIPAARSSANPSIAAYENLEGPFQTTFSPLYNNFSRIDLYFRNPGLANTDTFEVVVTDSEQNQVIKQSFSGFNTGDPSTLRFDFLPQSSSANQHYTVSVQPQVSTEQASETSLQVAVANADTNDLAIKTFYSSPQGLTEIVSQGITSVVNIFRQLPWAFIAFFALLFFL